MSVVLLLASTLVGGISAGSPWTAAPDLPGPDSLYHETRPAMGTTAEVYLYAPSRARASALFEAAFAEIDRVEGALSTYRPDSEISRINRLAADGPVTTDPEVFSLLRKALLFSERTNGAFDITVGPLVRAWGFFRDAGRLPSDKELELARRQSGWREVVLDAGTRSIRFRTEGIELDFGGIGKGWALDSTARLLRQRGVAAALLGLGQSSYYAIGAPPGSVGWSVAVPEPGVTGGVLSTVRLRDGSLSTSGATEQYFELDGRRYSHIIDPRTGRPSRGMVQVTVLAPTATDSDALSTSLFVLGPEGAGSLADGDGIEVLLVTEGQGEGRVVRIGWSGTIAY